MARGYASARNENAIPREMAVWETVARETVARETMARETMAQDQTVRWHGIRQCDGARYDSRDDSAGNRARNNSARNSARNSATERESVARGYKSVRNDGARVLEMIARETTAGETRDDRQRSAGNKQCAARAQE